MNAVNSAEARFPGTHSWWSRGIQWRKEHEGRFRETGWLKRRYSLPSRPSLFFYLHALATASETGPWGLGGVRTPS